MLMKFISLAFALGLYATLFSGCATRPTADAGYHQAQFSNRLDYLRVCQRVDPLGRNCH
jgi:hypothetical protein